VNPEAWLGNSGCSRLVLLGRRWLAVCVFGVSLIAGGCASTATTVKTNPDSKPSISNSICKAIFSNDSPKCAPKTTSGGFPTVPLDESSPTVKTFIREYAYGQRETMKRYLAQADQYLPMVKSLIKKNGLPEDLAYLFLLESGANPEARSPANALGMWQFMPATARSYGLRVDSWVDERLDPRKSTQAAITYMKDLYGMFGCWRLALSAYNSGENKMNRVLCQEDANEYDEICSSRHLKRETREFVPRFQAIAHIAKNPERYGFARMENEDDDSKYELAPVEGSYPLEKIAAATSTAYDELLELNPGLIRNVTPPSPSYQIRVPAGKKETLVAALQRLEPVETQQHLVHVVNKGDSLTKILKQYGLKKTQLAHLNPDVNFQHKLKPGSKLVVPTQKAQSKQRAPRKAKRLSRL
jgi:membrane-bound lytic murein transglycosylase D